MIAASVLAAGQVLRKGDHFEVRLFVEMLPARVQRAIDATVTILSAIFVIAVTCGVLQLLWQTYKFGFKSPTLLQIPLIYPQSILLVGFALLSLACIAKAVSALGRGKPR
jgi:TRAP-type C4-dicarboxylate transport system permease small subunit